MKRNLTCFFFIILIVGSGCSGKSKRNALKIVTLNVRYDNPADSANSWPNRASMVCNFILDEGPDIIGMQEVLWHQYEILDSVLTDYTSIGVGRDNGARMGEMNPVFFRKEKFDLVRSISFWLSETPEIPGSIGWGASLPRIVTWLQLVDKNSKQHFYFFNTHFAHDSDSARIMSSKILLREIEKITAGLPFIITGDFNMLPGSTGYNILTGPAESIPLLDDSYNVSEKRPSGPSFTYNGFSDKQGNGRIDFIFVKNGMKVLDHVISSKKEHGVFISDHWPVTAYVLINF
jgi:endonuclease/exonuclease/phosphatase family metal-dependent hydrolase